MKLQLTINVTTKIVTSTHVKCKMYIFADSTGLQHTPSKVNIQIVRALAKDIKSTFGILLANEKLFAGKFWNNAAS